MSSVIHPTLTHLARQFSLDFSSARRRVLIHHCGPSRYIAPTLERDIFVLTILTTFHRVRP